MAKKLIIQIPCLNEEHTLAITLADLPRQIPGLGRIEWLVVVDGSTLRPPRGGTVASARPAKEA